MNRNQNNVHRMSTATVSLLTDNDELINSFAVIGDQKTRIEGLIKEIGIHKEGQEDGDTTAKTKTKNELLADLSSRASKVAKKARGLAKVTGDNDLLTRVDFSPYDIADGSDRETLDTVDKILKAAKEKEPVLIESYNLASGEIELLEGIAKEIDGLINKRKTKVSSGKTSTANLSEAIKEIRNEWNVMDDLIEGIIDDENFIETYENTRRIGK